MTKKISFFGLLLVSLMIALSSCKKPGNPVLNYLENAELQYEGETQEENIVAALKDILSLPELILRAKKYKNYTGKEHQWDLPTLLERHFVPDRKDKSLGDNFYHDVKSEEVQKKIRQILDKISSANYRSSLMNQSPLRSNHYRSKGTILSAFFSSFSASSFLPLFFSSFAKEKTSVS